MIRTTFLDLVEPLLWGIRPMDARCQASIDAVDELLSFPGIDPFGRDIAFGHFTASGFILSPDRRSTLLMHHRKLDRWLQPGGHCDGNPDALAVARREIAEETGLAGLRLVAPGVVDLDRHRIPARGADAEHWHYDLRFLFEANADAELIRNEESKELRWVPIDRIEQWTGNPAVLLTSSPP